MALQPAHEPQYLPCLTLSHGCLLGVPKSHSSTTTYRPFLGVKHPYGPAGERVLDRNLGCLRATVSEGDGDRRVNLVGGSPAPDGASFPWYSRAGKLTQKSEKGVFRRGHQKAGTAGFTPHTMIDTARLGMDEITGI